ncbi:hypothetical protein [Deinococcus multiflagellatus]|uniref:Transposase n=2 Tax=Deinococcus multiflagellatus TaxID=1656887 RepID=A0ABW1ZR01_9DEIO
MMGRRDELSPAEQEAYARCLRTRLPDPLRLHSLTDYAARVLKKRGLVHWRGLSPAQAQQVMARCEAEHPVRRAVDKVPKVV